MEILGNAYIKLVPVHGVFDANLSPDSISGLTVGGTKSLSWTSNFALSSLQIQASTQNNTSSSYVSSTYNSYMNIGNSALPYSATPNSTSGSLTLKGVTAINNTIYLRATFSASNGRQTIKMYPVVNGITANTLSGSVSITGTNTWGNILTANVTNTNSATLAYQWYSNTSNSTSGGTAITGANSSTYTIDKDLTGKYIYVVVTATKTNYDSATWKDITDSSNSSATVSKQSLSVTVTPYNGSYDQTSHGATIKVTSSSWNGKTIVSGTSTSYGQNVTTNGSYNTTYALRPTYTDVTSTTIYYKVTGGDYYYDKTGNTSVTITSGSLSGSVTITGTNTWGNILTADVTNTNSATLAYQWYSNTSNSTSGGTAIGGATSSTYTIDKDLTGKYIYVVVTATKTNYDSATWKDITDSSNNSSATVSKQSLSVTVTPYNGTYDGSSHGATIKVTSSSWNGKTIVSGTSTSYGQSVTTNGSYNTTYALRPTYTDATSTTIYYKVTGGDYYYDKTGTTSVNISDLPVISYTAQGYSNVFDGYDHGITVTVSSPSGATIMYGTTNGTYNNSVSPTRRNAGTTTVYYQITKTGYQTVTGSELIEITKAQGIGSVTMANWTVGETAPNPVPSSSTNSITDVTYKYKGRGSTTYAESSTKPSTAGTYTVTATFPATMNYTSCTATADFQVFAAPTATPTRTPTATPTRTPTPTPTTTPGYIVEIWNKADAEEFRDTVNGGFDYSGVTVRLMADVDLQGNNLDPWTPIGGVSDQFAGTFEGNNHTISGLYINDGSSDYQGLFGYATSTSTIQNVTIEGSITGKNYIGGIAGYSAGTIDNCHSSVTISGRLAIGGIVGELIGGSVSNCHNEGALTSSDGYVGGISGMTLSNASISVSYNTGTIVCTKNEEPVGGVTGIITNSTVNNVYNTGSVTGTASNSSNMNPPYSRIGGVAGDLETGGTLTNAYNVGTVTNTALATRKRWCRRYS